MKNIKTLNIKLKGINNVSDLTSIFEGCSKSSQKTDFSNWDTSFVFNMERLF